MGNHFQRVPLSVFFPVLQRAYPHMPVTHLLSKAHAQLCLDLQKKVVMESIPSDVHDLNSFDSSAENLKAFQECYRFYLKYVLPLAKGPEAEKIVSEFRYWLLKKGIGFEGKVFNRFVKLKKILRNLYSASLDL
jgi:hypothetical protein